MSGTERVRQPPVPVIRPAVPDPVPVAVPLGRGLPLGRTVGTFVVLGIAGGALTLVLASVATAGLSGIMFAIPASFFGAVAGIPVGILAGLGAAAASLVPVTDRLSRLFAIAFGALLGALAPIALVAVVVGSLSFLLPVAIAAGVVAGLAAPFATARIDRDPEPYPRGLLALAFSGTVLGVVVFMTGSGFVQQLPYLSAPQPEPGFEQPVYDPPAAPEHPPLDASEGLSDTSEMSSAFTSTDLQAAMWALVEASADAAGPINDPDLPEGIHSYPLVPIPCGDGGIRFAIDAWFTTADNAAGVDRIDDFWASQGYTTLSADTGRVEAAGRDPLPAMRLELLQTWDEEDLRLQITSLCVAGQP